MKTELTTLRNFFDRFEGKDWADVEAEVRSLPCDRVRVLFPHSITTRDYQIDRLTVKLNSDNQVVNIKYC